MHEQQAVELVHLVRELLVVLHTLRGSSAFVPKPSRIDSASVATTPHLALFLRVLDPSS